MNLLVAKRTKDVPSRELQSYVILSHLSKGNFRQQLQTKLGGARCAEITLDTPPSVNQDQYHSYLSGLKRYIEWSQSDELDLNSFTEQDTYYVAVVAYLYRDVTPLSRYAERISSVSDRYYWFYLSLEEETFYAEMEIVSYHRLTISDLKLSQVKRLASDSVSELKLFSTAQDDIVAQQCNALVDQMLDQGLVLTSNKLTQRFGCRIRS
jgi:hypothetical protein